MDLSPYLEALRRDLAATAAPGGPDLERAAGLLAGSLESSARLALLEALSDAAAEITTRLRSASVDVRLRGRDADLVVTELPEEPDTERPTEAGPAADPDLDAGALTRLTLRMPEALKERVEHAAAAEGLSVNTWLVRTVVAAVAPGPGPVPPHPPRGPGRRITGYAKA